MLNSDTHFISLQRAFLANAEGILNLFKDSTIFKLTGADEVQVDFKTDGLLRLIFYNRGTIHGKFIKITSSQLILDWNVEGFQRPDEINTIVEITLVDSNDQCTLTLTHKNIKTSESASAKQRAWTELLNDVERRMIGNK